jgi:type VI secretion system secreted protein VgrG
MGLSARVISQSQATAKALIEIANELTIKCGGASIVLKSGGDILIKGAKIEIKGSQISVKSSGDLKLKGSNWRKLMPEERGLGVALATFRVFD